MINRDVTKIIEAFWNITKLTYLLLSKVVKYIYRRGGLRAVLAVVGVLVTSGVIIGIAVAVIDSSSRSPPASSTAASSPSPNPPSSRPAAPKENAPSKAVSKQGKSGGSGSVSPSPSPSSSSSKPSQVSTSRDAALASPEDALKAYAQSLTSKDYSRLKTIYPRESTEVLRSWVEGQDGLAPLTRVEVVGKPRREETSPDKVTLWATLQYCTNERANRVSRDSRDSKYYTFINNQGKWQLESMTAPEDIEHISC